MDQIPKPFLNLELEVKLQMGANPRVDGLSVPAWFDPACFVLDLGHVLVCGLVLDFIPLLNRWADGGVYA